MRAAEVAVIVPARDAERFVGAAVDSVRAQTLADWELIVVDDGSSDATVDVATRSGDERVRVMPSPGTGVTAARNAGLAASSAPLVMFLDADDRLRPRALELLRQALRADDGAVVAYSSYVKIDERGEIRGPARRLELSPHPSGDVLEQMLAGCFVKTPGAALVRRLAVDEVGAFDPRVPIAEDWELWCRLAIAGRYAYVANGDAFVEYRLHSSAATRRYRLATYERTIEHVFTSEAVRAAVPPSRLAVLWRRQVGFVCRFLAIQRLREGEVWRARAYLRRALRIRRTDVWAYALLALTRLPRVPSWIAVRVGLWRAQTE
jgi:glycosyltransferase involved in cell wall biosynthesis